MAGKRMFTQQIVDSDAFLEMPLSTQALYFHLAMRADDDGFLNNAKKIMKVIGSNQNDYDLLIVKRFIIQFEDGICVIKHWRMHNYIAKDRYKPTVFQSQFQKLTIKENKSYTERVQPVYKVDTQVRLDKDRLDKDRLDKVSIEEDISSMSVGTDVLPAPIVQIDYNSILNYWNSTSKLKEITAITDKRKGNLNARIKEYGIEAIYKVIDNASNSAFMRGNNKQNWMATFDWVFLPNNFIKVLEGNYLDKTPNDFNEIEERAKKVKDFYRIS